MKKRAVGIFIFTILIFISTVYAEDANSAAKVDKAYQCLQDQIKAKSTLSLQDAIFGMLALGAESKVSDAIEKEKKANEFCWPKSSCTIKDSAQVLMAYDRAGKDSKEIKNWLLSKAINDKELVWYLEIDIEDHNPSECVLRYDSKEYKINVKDDMTLSGNPGSCFEIGYGGYWLKIKDQCLDKQFEVSCDDQSQGNFITTLIYQKKSGGTVYVSSDTHSSAKGGTTSEKVNSKCFTTGNKCDYEGSLWAAIALSKEGENIGSYIPYLLTLSDDNQKYLPSAFLYILTAGDDSYSELIQKQKTGKYWDIIGSLYNKYYDSALALLALAGANSAEAEASKDYFLNSQTNEGCWNNNNIRDTGFLLFAAWPRSAIKGGGGGGGADCVSANYFCEPRDDCLGIGGTIFDEFQCTNFRESCCSKKVLDSTCDAKGGIVCSATQECSGRIEGSLDGSCCIGACQEIKPQNVCAVSGGSCQKSCLSTEEETDDSCPDAGYVCCKALSTPPSSSGNNYWIWITIMIILIIIVLILIIYRRRIQMWWHSRKNDSKTGPRGSPPRFGMTPRPMPRYSAPLARGPTPRVTRGVKSPQDKEMEETMRKLKEMSG